MRLDTTDGSGIGAIYYEVDFGGIFSCLEKQNTVKKKRLMYSIMKKHLSLQFLAINVVKSL